MKGLVITKRIDANTTELQLLKNSNICDRIDLSRCNFSCSDALEIIKDKPRTRVILSDEIKELINHSL